MIAVLFNNPDSYCEILSKIIQVKEPLTDCEPNVVEDPDRLAASFAQYASDESNLGGEIPKEICLASTWQEVSGYLARCSKLSLPIVIAGAQTGLVGGALGVANSAMLSLGRIHYRDLIVEDSKAVIRLGAGVSLSEINEHILDELPEFWFPVDPTETSASVGGMVAVGASGARSYKYGSIRNWVNWIRVVLSDGSYLEIRRGENLVKNGVLRIDRCGTIEELLISELPLEVKASKSTLGYALDAEMDLIDLFIGSEGSLGVITDIELRLELRPKEFLYVLQFFDQEAQSIEFVDAVEAAGLQPLAIESLDSFALRLVESSPTRANSKAMQQVSSKHQAAVYLEFAANTSAEIEELLGEYMLLLDASGIDPTECIAGMEQKDVRDMKLFRHAVPEQINSIIRLRKQTHSGLHKLALDMAVPRAKRCEVFKLYKEAFSNAELEFSIFGHAGDAHFHVNILAKDEAELAKAKNVYEDLAKVVVEMGGCVAAEHGLGRLKKHLLAVQFDESVLLGFQRIKSFFDPQSLISNGVLVPSVTE